MKTIKRSIPELNTNLKNTTKYFNQLDFKGIVEDKNIFALDQESFSDALNVYVNGDGQFVSRDSLQKDITIPSDPAKYFGYELIEYRNIGNLKLLIRKNQDNQYVVLLYRDDNTYYELDKIKKYKIAVIEHYVICFNENGAKIFDSSKDIGWEPIENYAEIPIIKRTVGSQITEFGQNAFSSKYKEQYVWSNDSKPVFQIGPRSEKIELEVSIKNDKNTYILTEPEIATDYRVLKKITLNSVNADDLVLIKNDTMCIAKDGYFLISYNNGDSFTTVYYPEYDTFLNIAGISETGTYFYFVASNGVYRCDLGNLTWAEVDKVANNETGNISKTGYYNISYFKNDDTYAFITYDGEYANVYYKGPGLYQGDVSNKGKLIEVQTNFMKFSNLENITDYRKQLVIDSFKDSILMFYNIDTNTGERDTTLLINCRFDSSIYETNNIIEIFNKNMYNGVNTSSEHINFVHLLSGTNVTKTTGATRSYGADVIILSQVDSNWITAKYIVEDYEDSEGVSRQRFELSSIVEIVPTGAIGYSQNTPMKLAGGYICGTQVYDEINKKWVYIDGKYGDTDIIIVNDIKTADSKLLYTNGNYLYILLNNSILYTNKLSDSDIGVFTITFSKFSNKFILIPDITYSDTELYLSFGNELKITENTKTVDENGNTKILFNLPDKNNQTFINDITAMINISTTDVALFFKDKITLCSKVEDEKLGYRYDYYNTKLSLGVRLNDSVINTLEGSYTVFPTIRGLAIMNYQAFMATTDQIVEYLTDSVKELWDKFYASSNMIKIIQFRNHLIIINGTKDILLYNINYKTWWKWQIPYNTSFVATDQIVLQLIVRGELCVFTNYYKLNNEIKDLKYFDFSANGEKHIINWKVQSQPLHFNAINYYKNLKQLVFQLTNDSETEEANTINAQIKLYRKYITLRDPSVISFTIEKLRTFVKRFNYWKINELQWALANDENTNNPIKFKLNGISIKYELSDEVR